MSEPVDWAYRKRIMEQAASLRILADNLYEAYYDDLNDRVGSDHRVVLWAEYRHVTAALRNVLRALGE
jgi:hypothetical protein